MKGLNDQLNVGGIHIKAFPRAKCYQLNHYIAPNMEEYSCSPSQNIWHERKKYSKIGQGFKNVISNFPCFLTAIINV